MASGKVIHNWRAVVDNVGPSGVISGPTVVASSAATPSGTADKARNPCRKGRGGAAGSPRRGQAPEKATATSRKFRAGG